MTEVWTLPDCPECERVKADLRRAGIPFAERSLPRLRRGEILDVDAMTEVVMRDGKAPMVRVDGRFLNDDELTAFLKGTCNG
jgi:glutaredoxin